MKILEMQRLCLKNKAKKIYLYLLFLFISILNQPFSFASYNIEIDVSRNAIDHNNQGVYYLQNGWYYQAIQKFQLAIELNPNVQATANYYDNLGIAYMRIGQFKLASNAFEMAIKQNSLFFIFYLHLMDSYKAQGILQKKIYEYSKKPSDYQNTMMLGLMFIANGNKQKGCKILQELIEKEPDFLISEAISKYLNGLN